MDYEDLRNLMVERQLIPRGISDEKVLSAFRKVPRHEFVPDEQKDYSYDDHPLPIGNSQTISQPYIVALMTECLGIKGGEKVLEVGSGSGYQAAILRELGSKVYTIERIEHLAKTCRKTLIGLGYSDVSVVIGDGSLGYVEESPYDGIIVTCAAPKLPDSYIGQINEGGRIVIPIGSRHSQIMTVVTKLDKKLEIKQISGCVFVPLVGKDAWGI